MNKTRVDDAAPSPSPARLLDARRRAGSVRSGDGANTAGYAASSAEPIVTAPTARATTAVSDDAPVRTNTATSSVSNATATSAPASNADGLYLMVQSSSGFTRSYQNSAKSVATATALVSATDGARRRT